MSVDIELKDIFTKQQEIKSKKYEYKLSYYLKMDRGIITKQMEQLPPITTPLTITYFDFKTKQNVSQTFPPSMSKVSTTSSSSSLEEQRNRQYLSRILSIKNDIEFLKKVYADGIFYKAKYYYEFLTKLVTKLTEIKNQFDTLTTPSTDLDNFNTKIIEIYNEYNKLNEFGDDINEQLDKSLDEFNESYDNTKNEIDDLRRNIKIYT